MSLLRRQESRWLTTHETCDLTINESLHFSDLLCKSVRLQVTSHDRRHKYWPHSTPCPASPGRTTPVTHLVINLSCHFITNTDNTLHPLYQTEQDMDRYLGQVRIAESLVVTWNFKHSVYFFTNKFTTLPMPLLRRYSTIEKLGNTVLCIVYCVLVFRFQELTEVKARLQLMM